MKEKIVKLLDYISSGYTYKIKSVVYPDYEKETEITEHILMVENPYYRPDGGSDPFHVVTLKEKE